MDLTLCTTTVNWKIGEADGSYRWCRDQSRRMHFWWRLPGPCHSTSLQKVWGTSWNLVALQAGEDTLWIRVQMQLNKTLEGQHAIKPSMKRLWKQQCPCNNYRPPIPSLHVWTWLAMFCFEKPDTNYIKYNESISTVTFNKTSLVGPTLWKKIISVYSSNTSHTFLSNHYPLQCMG